MHEVRIGSHDTRQTRGESIALTVVQETRIMLMTIYTICFLLCVFVVPAWLTSHDVHLYPAVYSSQILFYSLAWKSRLLGWLFHRRFFSQKVWHLKRLGGG
jgi:hypothetical protein